MTRVPAEASGVGAARRTPVSVLITARDEEELLPGALASVRGWADEVVVVVDPRSSDATADIAAVTGATVLTNEFVNSAAQCNWGLERCNHRWALVVDADERVSATLRGSISAIVEAPRAAAYAVRRLNFAFGQPLRHGDWGRDWIVRLLDRQRARFNERSVHGAVEAAQVGRLDGVLEHHTLRSLRQYLPKLHDYAARGAADLAAAGKRGSLPTAVFRSQWRLVRCLLLRVGVLDGPAGWAVGGLVAYGTFLKWLALWELEGRGKTMSSARRSASTGERLPAAPRGGQVSGDP